MDKHKTQDRKIGYFKENFKIQNQKVKIQN